MNDNDTTAIVLAAGEGNRLHPLTKNRPKPMLPAAAKPILEHVFDQLIDAGITEIVVVVGYKRERIQSHFGPSYRDVPLTYVTQDKQLGTGHAVLAAEAAVDGTCLVVNGDQIAASRIIRDTLEAHDTAATVALLQRSSVDGYGGVLVDEDRVTTIVEDPPDDREYLLNAGIYVLEPVAFDAIRAAEPRAGERLLVDGLSKLIEWGDVVRGAISEGFWVDATYPWDLLDVSFELFDTGLIDRQSTRNVHETATVHESAVIREPVIVDRDCVIEPGAVVGPNVCLGENTTVGSNAVVERSVVDTDTRIGANATVTECVTGTGVRIGQGSTIPGGPGDVRVADRVFENETLGALLADRVHDHGGVTYVPGTLVGPRTEIQAGTTVRGTLEAGTEVRS
ncbi:sugar phosphate nucleotidyltransferase [Natronorubrum sulfidifaciens]|uniref:Bifunctional protein GlmU n=1 Tax=Natronorubrum sulfidifaciens JCM 14089 TaxID=1230460 RepID=L9W193_9EURY|nr:sugar phosphate nucleotidyltransferase [Natronorubrum sulfidifaciens]ELY42073.1 nucleotidyl transferase [Natronorubrum sulfidifaciens JCM 14089]